MGSLSLSDQFDLVMRTTGSEREDWDNAKLQEEFKRMIREEPRVPAWVTLEISRSPNTWSMDI